MDGSFAVRILAESGSWWRPMKGDGRQLDLVDEPPFRGSRLFSADQLRPLMVVDERGFRRIRDGAEGFFLLLYKGMPRGGRPDWLSIKRYRVIEKLTSDWSGAEATAALLGRAGDLGGSRRSIDTIP
jgi:hypothetical protein